MNIKNTQASSDGMPIVNIDTTDYISLYSIKCDRCAENTSYHVVFNNGKYSLVKTNENGKQIKKVISDIPYIINDGLSYIALDYYETKLRPIVKCL